MPTTAPPLLTGDESSFADYYTRTQNRIPGGAALEAQSSDVISGLLGTPEGAMFPDVSRMSAERGASTGVPGSPNAFGVGLRMSDDERLRRISLGQQFLSAAGARTPAIGPEYSFMQPGQSEALSLDRERLDLQRKATELDNVLKALQIRRLTPLVRGDSLPMDPGAFGTPGTKPGFVNPFDEFLEGLIGGLNRRG